MADTFDDVTELVELNATKVSGVSAPANGTPWLLLKAAAPDAEDATKADADTKPCPTCDGKGTIMEGNRECPDCGGTGKVAKSDSAEADEIEETMTGSTAKSDSEEADEQEAEMTGEAEKADADFLEWVEKSDLDDATKAELKAADRNKLADSDFAYVDSNGKRHLPIHDKGHVQAALGRFGQTQFESEDKKKAAAGKIKDAASEHGVDVDDESEVGQATKAEDETPVEKSPGVPDFATAEPKATGTVTTFAESGVVGPATGAIKPDADTDPPMPLGGESTRVIPAESRLGEPHMPDLAAAAKADEDDDLIHIVEKDGLDFMSQANTPVVDDGDEVPGSPVWESYDAATLDQVAQGLAACSAAVDNIRQREAVEAVTGSPGDWQDAMDLETACDAIDAALGFVARLAYHEGAEVQKAGRRLSAASESHARAARDHLTALLGDGKENPAGSAGTDTSEEDDIMATLTKEELAAMVATAATKAVSDYDEARKAAKKERKADAERAEKNANNKGEVTEQDERDAVNGEHDANDLASAGGSPKPEFVNKGEGSDESGIDTLTELVKGLAERVEKFAKRPRSGGPVLDGVARAYVPAEGRQGEGVAKSADEQETERLTKAMEDEKDPVRKAELSQQVTYRQLLAAHEAGRI